MKTILLAILISISTSLFSQKDSTNLLVSNWSMKRQNQPNTINLRLNSEPQNLGRKEIFISMAVSGIIFTSAALLDLGTYKQTQTMFVVGIGLTSMGLSGINR
jgi:hypothetical protein